MKGEGGGMNREDRITITGDDYGGRGLLLSIVIRNRRP